MAIGNYPSFPQMAGSTVAWVDDLVADRSDAGNVRMRALYPSKKRIFTLTHWLYSTDMTDIEAHYDSNRLLNFSFTWALDGSSYLCVYGAKPTFSTTNSSYTVATVVLLEQ